MIEEMFKVLQNITHLVYLKHDDTYWFKVIHSSIPTFKAISRSRFGLGHRQKFHIEIKKTKNSNPYNQVPHLIPEGKVTKHQKTSHTREPRGQPFLSRWPQGCKEQTRKHNNSKIDPQKKHRLGTVSKILEGLPIFNGTNLPLSSDVDQDTFENVTKYIRQEGQEVSPFPAGDHKSTGKRQQIKQA